jgi:hypothetical protein
MWPIWSVNKLTCYKYPKVSFIYVTCFVATPLWRKCEVATHTPENGNLESSRIPKNSEDDCKGQNTLHWGVLYIVGKVLKCKCSKWPRMSHLGICSPSYGQLQPKLWAKEGPGVKLPVDSRPLKVMNRPAPDVLWGSAIRRWKAFDESYTIGSNLVPIRGRGEKLWPSKVLGIQTGTVSGLHFGSPGTKSHLKKGLSQHQKDAEWVLTTLWLVLWCRTQWLSSLSLFLV